MFCVGLGIVSSQRLHCLLQQLVLLDGLDVRANVDDLFCEMLRQLLHQECL
jgi:hypothetical protein